MIPVIDHTTVFGRVYLDALRAADQLPAQHWRHLIVGTEARTIARWTRVADLGANIAAQSRDDRVMNFMYWYREMGNTTPAQALTILFPEDFQT